MSFSLGNQTGTATSSTNPITQDFNIGADGNFLVVVAEVHDPGGVSMDATYDGQPMTYVGASSDGTHGSVEMWIMENPHTGTCQFSVGNPGSYVTALVMASYISSTGAGAFSRKNTGNGTSTNPSLNVTGTAANSLMVGACVDGYRNQVTQGANYTSLRQRDAGNWTYCTEYDLDTGAAGTIAVNFVMSTSDGWGIVAASFKETTPPVNISLKAANIAATSLSITVDAGTPPETTINLSRAQLTADGPQLSVSTISDVTVNLNVAQLTAQGKPLQINPIPLRSNGSRDFNGTTDRIDWSNKGDLQGHALTVAAWINSDGWSGSADYILTLHGAGDTNYNLALQLYAVNAFYLLRAGTISNMYRNGILPSGNFTGGWHLILATTDGTWLDASKINCYIDGVLRNGVSAANGSGTEITCTGKVSVGGRYYDDTRNYDGKAGEVAIWDRVLTLAEIESLSEYPLKSALSIPSGLIFCEHPDEPKDLVTGETGTVDGTTLMDGPDLLYISAINLNPAQLTASAQPITIEGGTPSPLTIDLQTARLSTNSPQLGIVTPDVYYVDATGGNDGWDGMTTGTPWQTLSKVNSSTFSPGDQILFKRGETWRESLNVPSNGNASAQITFGAYGSGNKPKILGSTQLTNWIEDTGHWVCDYVATVNLIWFKNASDGKIKWGNKKTSKALCVAEFDWYSDGTKVWVYAATDPDTRYTTVEAAVRNYGVNADHRTYITVRDLEVAYCGQYGIANLYSDASNWLIDSNEVHHIGVVNAATAEGIFLRGSNHVASNNLVYQCGNHGISTSAMTGAILNQNIVIELNEVKDCYHTLIDIQTLTGGDALNITIRYNKLYTTDEMAYPTEFCNFIYCSGQSDTDELNGVDIYYNLLYNLMDAGIQLDRYTKNGHIYNNTICGENPLHTNVNLVGISVSTVNVIGTKIKNNIAKDFHSRCMYLTNGVVISECDYNCWYNTIAVDYYVAYGGVDYGVGDFAAYKTASGFDTHGFWENPDFANEAGYDFNLDKTSPCINSGTSVSLTRDYVGNPIYGSPDIGAFEFGVEVILDVARPIVIGQLITPSAPAPGGVQINLSPAQLTALGNSLAVQAGEKSTALSPAQLTASGKNLTISAPAPGAIQVNLSVASLSAGGKQLSVQVGERTIALNPAQLLAQGKNVTISSPPPGLQINLSTATLSTSGESLIVQEGAVSISLGTAQFSAQGKNITVGVGDMPQTINFGVAQLSASAKSLDVQEGAVSISFGVGKLSATGKILDVQEGEVTISVGAAHLVSNGKPTAIIPGAISISFDPAQLTAIGQTIAIIVPSPQTINLDSALLFALGQPIDIVTEGISPAPCIPVGGGGLFRNKAKNIIIILPQNIDEKKKKEEDTLLIIH